MLRHDIMLGLKNGLREGPHARAARYFLGGKSHAKLKTLQGRHVAGLGREAAVRRRAAAAAAAAAVARAELVRSGQWRLVLLRSRAKHASARCDPARRSSCRRCGRTP
eukprot:240215-Prymnesium_polylepis.1